MVVGVTLVGAVLTSVAFVAGAGGRPRYAGPERDPLRERIEVQAADAERAVAQLQQAIASPAAERSGSRLRCLTDGQRVAAERVAQLRAEVIAFQAATQRAATVERLKAADRARRAQASFDEALRALAGCH